VAEQQKSDHINSLFVGTVFYDSTSPEFLEPVNGCSAAAYRLTPFKKFFRSPKVGNGWSFSNLSQMNKMSPIIAFICVVYNNFSDTADFCRSLQMQKRDTTFRLQCTIVNNSTDRNVSKELLNLQYSYDFVKILNPGRNLGYFGGLNYGISNLKYRDCNYVVICNNDLEFFHDFCIKLLDSNFSDDTYVVCPDVITKDGVHQNPHVLKPLSFLCRLKLDVYFAHYYLALFLKLLRFFATFLQWKSSIKEDLKPSFLHMGIGACYILLPRFFQIFTGLEYPFFLYGEEAFLSNQIHSAGGKIFFNPALKVFHKESATLSTLPSRIAYEYAREGYSVYRKLY
jgi:GT2 family glycosyltransferase